MKTKRMKLFGLTMILSLLCGLGFVSMPNNSLQASAADVKYSQFMLVSGNPTQTELDQPAGQLIIDGQVIDNGNEISHKFVLGQKNIEISASANQGFVLTGWYILYEDDSLVNFIPGTTNGYISITNEDQLINNDLLKVNAFSVANKQASLQIVEMFENIKIAPVFDYQYFNVSLKAINNEVKDIGSFKFGDNVVINETIAADINIDATNVITSNKEITVNHSFTKDNLTNETTAYAINFVMSTYQDVELELVYDNLYKVDLKFYLQGEELADYSKQEFVDLFSCLTVKNDKVWDEGEGKYVSRERYFTKLNEQGTSFYVKQNRNFEISVLNNFRNANGYIYYNFESLDSSTSNLTANYNDISQDKVINIKYVHNTFKVDFVGVVLNNDNTVQVNEDLIVPDSVESLTRVNPDLELTNALLQTNVGYNFEGFAKFVEGKGQYSDADLELDKVSLDIDAPKDMTIYVVYSKSAYSINLTNLTTTFLQKTAQEKVYPIASAKIGSQTKEGTSLTFGSFYIGDTITLEVTLNKGFVLNSIEGMTKADESKEVYTLLLDTAFLTGKTSTIDLAISADTAKYSLTYKINQYSTSAMADISVEGYDITETLVDGYYEIVVENLTYYQTVKLQSKANQTANDGEYYLFKWFTTDFKSTITSGLSNDGETPALYSVPFTVYGDSVVYVVYAEPKTQMEIRINSAPANSGITFVVNQEETQGAIESISGLYALNQNKQVTVSITGLTDNENLFGYKFINLELYTLIDGVNLNKIVDSESTSTTSYVFKPTTSDIYVLMVNIQKVEYMFNITSNTSFTMSKVLTVEDTLIEFEKPTGYYVGRVMIQKKDLEYEEYANMNQNNSSRNGQLVGDKDLFKVFTYVISTERVDGARSEFEQIIEKYGIGTTDIVVNIQLTFNIYTYEVNLKYYKFNNNAIDGTSGVKITYPMIQLSYTVEDGDPVVAASENLAGEVKFKYIPYNANVELAVVRGVSAGFEMKGWYDYNATYKLANSGTLTDQEKLLQYSIDALKGDYKLSYRVDYVEYTAKLVYNQEEGTPLINNADKAIVKMGDKIEIVLNASLDKGFMGYSVGYNQPIYTKYEYTTDEQFAIDYTSLVIIENGYIYNVLSDEYKEDVEYFTVSSENVVYNVVEFTDDGFDIGTYVADVNKVINFELKYIPVEMKIKNISETVDKLDANGNVEYEALNLEKIGLTAEQIATYTIYATSAGVTRSIDENSGLVTINDIITIDIKINEAESTNGEVYKLYKGLNLYTYPLTNNWAGLTCVATGEGAYQIQFAIANNITTEFAEKGVIEINYGYQQKGLRTITATTNMASSTNFINATELGILIDGDEVNSYQVGSISKVDNFLSSVSVALDLKTLKDYFVINSITAYAGSVHPNNVILDYSEYCINPVKVSETGTGRLVVSHVELTLLDVDVIIQFNVQPRLYLEGTEITTQSEYLFTRTYAIDNEGNGVAQTFTLGSDLTNSIAGYGINSSIMKLDVYKNSVLQSNGAINVGEYDLKLVLIDATNTDSWLYYLGDLPIALKLKINPLTIQLQSEVNSQFKMEYKSSSEYDIKLTKVGNKLQSADGNISLLGVANKTVFNLGLLTFDSKIAANIVTFNDKGELANQKYVTANYVGILITGLKLQNNNNFVLQLDEYVYNGETVNGLLIESCVQIIPKVVNILNLNVYDKVEDGTPYAKFGLIDGATNYIVEYTFTEDDVYLLSDELKIYFADRKITQAELATRNIDDIINEIKSSTVGEGKYIVVDARTALAGAQRVNYVVGEFRVGVVHYDEANLKTIYPYKLTTQIKGVGNISIINKRGLTDNSKVNLIPVNATLDVERIEAESAGYREIYDDISSFLSRRNVFAAGYKLSIIDKNGSKIAVNNELYLSVPGETDLKNVISLSGGRAVDIDFLKDGGNILIDLNQINEDISYIIMVQDRSLLEAWQIVLIVVLSVVVLAGAGVAVFFIVRKRKLNNSKYDTI